MGDLEREATHGVSYTRDTENEGPQTRKHIVAMSLADRVVAEPLGKPQGKITMHSDLLAQSPVKFAGHLVTSRVNPEGAGAQHSTFQDKSGRLPAYQQELQIFIGHLNNCYHIYINQLQQIGGMNTGLVNAYHQIFSTGQHIYSLLLPSLNTPMLNQELGTLYHRFQQFSHAFLQATLQAQAQARAQTHVNDLRSDRPYTTIGNSPAANLNRSIWGNSALL